MNKIIKILMERDGYTEEEASDLFEEVKAEIDHVIDTTGDYNEVEDIMLSDLRLEMDYIYEFLD